MLRKSRKGQSLVEFALILPVFLLLLLGVIEGARIVWAYVTVQTAAREAARYAITGRPYVGSSDSVVEAGEVDGYGQDSLSRYLYGVTDDLHCRTIDGQPNQDRPWVCDVTDRVEAVKKVAIRRAATLAISDTCGPDEKLDGDLGSYTDYFDNGIVGECSNRPGAFGVLVTGFTSNSEVAAALGCPETNPGLYFCENHPGDEGLNVSVATYYNVQMLDPIYDTLMGGNFVRVQGRVEMQNEGIDKSLGAVPPPPLPDVPLDGTGGTGLGSGPQILPAGSSTVGQGEVFQIRLLNHRDDPPYYDIYLEPMVGTGTPVKLCPPTADGFTVVETDPNGNGVYNCRISTAIPPGEYRLFSTKADAGPSTILAAFETVTVLVGDTPLIAIEGGNTWAENTKITINMINHQAADEQFNLYFFDGTSETLIGGPYDAEPPPSDIWKIPSTASTTCQPGGAGCQIFTRSDNPSANDPYAVTDIYVIRPEIILAQGQTDYQAGETIRVALIGHSPNKKYEIQITSTPTGTHPSSYTAAQVTTDSAGQYSTLEIPIPDALLSGVGPGAWEDGDYVITTHQVDGTGVADLSDFIAEKAIRVDTPTDPYITVDGGYSWPIDSFINIKVHLHQPVAHFLEFGSWRVPTGTAGDTFTPNPTFGTATVGYRIPITAVTGSAPQDFVIRSFKASDPTVEVARVTVRVIPEPVIQVLEGDKALPDATITIRILNHSPQSPYRIYYGKEIGNSGSVGKSLFTLITDSNGKAQTTYNLSNLPVSPPPDFTDPANCACYGVPYEMYSESFGQQDRLAFTELTIDSADLAITQVDVPLDAQINTTRTVTLTIQNLKPVTISRYFDIDFYHNPSPLVPSYQAGRFNFPGDDKLWQNFVAPNGQPGDTFTITSTVYLGTYGEQKLYGYADTSDFIFAENSEVNNIGDNTFQVTCTPTLITDNFNSGSLSSSWKTKVFGPDTDGVVASIESNRLRLTSDGKWTGDTNDNNSGGGFLYLHRSAPVTTTNGLDVIVQMFQSPTSSNYSKAGIQLRNSLDGNSMKIEFNLAYRQSNGDYRVQVSYRNPAGNWVTNHKDSTNITYNTSNPVWLRIERLPGSNSFNFYYKKQSSQPTAAQWGDPYTSVTVPMADQLYLGLFTASYIDGNYQTSRFDNFSYTDPSSCPPGTGLPVSDPPPGLTLCTDLLTETGFEKAPPQAWQWPLGTNINLNPSATESHSGLRSLDASTYDGSFNKPFFYQRFTMPSWVISSTTTFNLNLYRDIDDYGTADTADQFYAIVATTPATATAITSPTLVAEGVATPNWQFVSETLPGASGVDLEPYADQDLYIYFYNNSNANCPPLANCHDTRFLFDDVQLTTCTTQPPPDVVSTLITGEVTLHRLGGSSQKIAGVKVWAYAENGDLYETFTDQNGHFNFYNLPTTPSGVEYLIYSEHHIVDAFDSSQIETLSTDTLVILKTTNTASRPLVVDLDLYTITP